MTLTSMKKHMLFQKTQQAVKMMEVHPKSTKNFKPGRRHAKRQAFISTPKMEANGKNIAGPCLPKEPKQREQV